LLEIYQRLDDKRYKHSEWWFT